MINEDMNQALGDVKSEIFRDFRVASQGRVVNVHDKQVDVQLLICDKVGDAIVAPPVVKNLYVAGSGSMPNVNSVGIVLHLDRRNMISSELQNSGGPAHEIGYGVFLPLIT